MNKVCKTWQDKNKKFYEYLLQHGYYTDYPHSTSVVQKGFSKFQDDYKEHVYDDSQYEGLLSETFKKNSDDSLYSQYYQFIKKEYHPSSCNLCDAFKDAYGAELFYCPHKIWEHIET